MKLEVQLRQEVEIFYLSVTNWDGFSWQPYGRGTFCEHEALSIPKCTPFINSLIEMALGGPWYHLLNHSNLALESAMQKPI